MVKPEIIEDFKDKKGKELNFLKLKIQELEENNIILQ